MVEMGGGSKTEIDFTEKAYSRLKKIVDKDRELNWWMFFVIVWLLMLTITIIIIAIYLSKSLNGAASSFDSLANEATQIFNQIEALIEKYFPTS